MRGVLAIDIGTGSVKACVFDERSKLVARVTRRWEPSARASSVSDFDCSTAWSMVKDVVRDVIPHSPIPARKLDAVAVGSIRSGFVLLDENNDELWACWSLDRRAAQAMTTMSSAAPGFDAEDYAVTGQSASFSAAPRMLWLREARPKIMERARHLLPISDWLATRLGGRNVAETATASTMGLVDVRRRRLHPRVLTRWDLDERMLVSLVEAGTVVGEITENAALATGLVPGTRVVSGGADTQLAVLALGGCEAGNTAYIVGGSHWQQSLVVDEVLRDASQIRVSCHTVRPHLLAEALSLNVGVAVQWLIDLLGGNAPSLLAEAAAAPPGASGLLATVSPAMQFMDWKHPTGGLVGVDFAGASPSRGEMLRSLLEHAAVATAANLTVLEGATGERIGELVMGGGAARNLSWVQMVADATQRVVRVPDVGEATARGVAACAAIGAGWFTSLAKANPPANSSTIEPNEALAGLYEDLRGRWEEVDRVHRQISAEGVAPASWNDGSGIQQKGTTAL